MTNLVRTELEAEFDSKLADNTSQDITATDLRSCATDLNDTIFRDDAVALDDKTGRIMLDQGGYLLRDFTADVWLPTDIDDLVLWLDGSDIGSTSDQWDDKSGQANHHVKITDPVGSFPTDGGDGSRDFNGAAGLDGPAWGAGGVGLTEGEIFVRLKIDADPPATTDESGLWYLSTLTSSANDHYPWTNSTIYNGFATTARKTVGNSSVDLTAYHTLNVYSATNDWELLINGASEYSTATNTVSFNTVESKIGRSSGVTVYFNGNIKSICMFSRKLTSGERALMNTYMDSL